MADTVFYSTENHHNERELTIVNAALLVSKPPTKEKRIRIKIRMLLSGSVNMGSPAWLDKCYAFVAENGDKIQPSIEFKGYDLHFSAQNLFEAEGPKAPRCQMKKFEILEVGSSESPDVAAEWTIYAPFSTALWEWLGAFGGETCWCSFTPGVAESEPPEGDTDEDEEDEDETDEEEDSDVPEGGEDDTEASEGSEGQILSLVPSKSGPKDLAAYHEKQLDGEQKRGRGRPRKTPVDPLTVNEATAF